MDSLAPLVAFEHHMDHDLNGYPGADAGRQLNLGSYLTAIAEVFDALRAEQYHRGGGSLETTLRFMCTTIASKFHPLLLHRFVKLMGLYRRGTFVHLDTGVFRTWG